MPKPLQKETHRPSGDHRSREDAECRRFLQEYEAFHADLRVNHPASWAELEKERRSFDGTLMDGLEDE